MPISLGELAERFGCELIGDPDVIIDSVATLENAGRGALTFLASASYKSQLASTKADAVVLHANDAADTNCAALVADDPYSTYARMAAAICPPPSHPPGIHESAIVAASATVADSAHIAANAVVEDGASIGANCYIAPGAVVGPDCSVGDDCRVLANATLVRKVSTGERCIFHSGCVIGSDGFGNAMTPEGWLKVPQVGGVRIGSDVEIGACTSVDCGAIDDTVISDGVRIDNQVQIAHNVRVGDHTAMAAGVGVAGSTRIGKRCLFGGMVGIAGHLTICDDAIVHGKTMVSKDIREPGSYASMFPIEDARTWNRRVASLRRLDKLQKRVSDLEKKSQ